VIPSSYATATLQNLQFTFGQCRQVPTTALIFKDSKDCEQPNPRWHSYMYFNMKLYLLHYYTHLQNALLLKYNRKMISAVWTIDTHFKGKGSPYSITKRRVKELIPVLCTQPAGEVSHKPSGRLPLLSTRPAVTPRNPLEGCYLFCCLVNRGTMGVNSLPKTITRQCRDCNLNPGLLRLSLAR